MTTGRIRFIATAFVSIILLLVARILYIQLYLGNDLTIQATAQKIVAMPFGASRGNILDRNLIPLTNRSQKYDLIIKPLEFKNNNKINEISQILGLDFSDVKKNIEARKEPLLIEIDKDKRDLLKKENLYGLSLINSLKRYDQSTPAKHVLGYLNKTDMVGETGIEKFYDNTLRSKSPNKVGVIMDGEKNNLIAGLGYRLIKTQDTSGKMNIKLTLDYNIQRISENVIDKYNLKGAVVIEEVSTGKIVAMVSKPDFNPNSVGDYLQSPNNELFNRAVASYNLGSIFKIIDLASAYSKNIDPPIFYFCPGYVMLGDREFRCSTYAEGGHGQIDLHEAFASSCNPYFIELGIRTGDTAIIDMAKKFGLGMETGISSQGIAESSGNLPMPNNILTHGDIANLATGQGDVMATPLQVADMVATIANGGIKNKINIVDSIVDSEGKTIKLLGNNEGKRIIDKHICDKIKNLMEEVTISGTGIRANLDEYGGAGGKTGSAETGQYIGGEKIVHAWFAGYFPRLDPKYSISVFIENGKSGGTVAAPIFEEIARNILMLGL